MVPETPQLVVTLMRQNKKRYSVPKLQEGAEEIIGGATAGSRKMWVTEDISADEPIQQDGLWVYTFRVSMTRRKGRKPLTIRLLNAEKNAVMEAMHKKCRGSKWGDYKWWIEQQDENWNEDDADPVVIPESVLSGGTGGGEKKEKEFSVNDIITFDRALTLDDIDIPEVLIQGSDDEIEEHPAFNGIFGRGAHVRVMFASLRRMKETEGKVRNHVLLWGLPACAKTTLMHGFQQVVGNGAFVSINGNAATKAGIETIFLDRLPQVGVPPLLFIEEIEKTLEIILNVWLSVLDERAEVRKVTFHNQKRAEARVLVCATANDKRAFDLLMGGRQGSPGAISSRFTKQLYVPRPDHVIMRKILHREIEKYGGSEKWIKPALDLAQQVKTNDPRTVISFLDGGERLLTGEYAADILKIRELAEKEAKESGE